jgi:hypothetical protein
MTAHEVQVKSGQKPLKEALRGEAFVCACPDGRRVDLFSAGMIRKSKG